MTEQLIWTLSRLPGLEVIARSSSIRYKNNTQPLKDLAPQLTRELGVGAVLQGDLQRQGSRVLLNLTLTDTASMRVRWSKHFDTASDSLTGLQAQVAEQVALALGIHQARQSTPAVDGDAYTLYLQGRQRYLRYTQADNAAAMDLFRASLARSPAYAPALAGLSDSYAQAVYQYGAPDTQLDEALRYADAAVALAPQLAEAHKARGLALDLQGRRREAAASYHEASRLNPSYSDALINEAILHWESGRLADAYQLARRATSLDPLDPYAYLITSQVLTSAGFAPAALAILDQVQKHAPESAIAQTIRCAHWFETGQLARAESECKTLLAQHADFSPGWTLAADVALSNGQSALALQRFKSAAGMGAGTDAFYARLRMAAMQTPPDQAELRSLIKELQHRITQHNEDPDQQLQLAMLQAAAGQPDAAMDALEAAVASGHSDRHWLHTDPLLASLRQHARFAPLLARLDARLASEHTKLQSVLDKRGAPALTN